MSKVININNGVGTSKLINGTYDVTSNVPGYDNSTISPNSINIIDGISQYDFTIAATGVLTLHVTEDGTQTGTPIVGATFVRTDSKGNQYGTPITTDVSGNAIFTNVPFANENAPIIYFKQISSDGNHEFEDDVQSTIMTSSTKTIQIQNEPGDTRIFTLKDAIYSLPITSGNIILTNKN